MMILSVRRHLFNMYWICLKCQRFVIVSFPTQEGNFTLSGFSVAWQAEFHSFILKHHSVKTFCRYVSYMSVKVCSYMSDERLDSQSNSTETIIFVPEQTTACNSKCYQHLYVADWCTNMHWEKVELYHWKKYQMWGHLLLFQIELNTRNSTEDSKCRQ